MTGPLSLMATGHRELAHPAAVRAGFARALVEGGYQLAIVGGAEGADDQAARGAVDVKVPFRLVLPNRYYRRRYPRSVSNELMALAAEVVYSVDRWVESGEDPVSVWHRHHWEADNLARNADMGRQASAAAVCSSTHPYDLTQPGLKGGTAHCARTLKAQGHSWCWWIHDDPSGVVERVELGAATLFPGSRLPWGGQLK